MCHASCMRTAQTLRGRGQRQMKGRLEHLHCVPLRSFSALLFSPFPASLDGALGTGMRCCPLEHPHARASSFPTPTPVSSDRPCHAITASSNRLDVAPISLCTPVLAGHSPGARDDFTDHCRNVLRGVALPPPHAPNTFSCLTSFTTSAVVGSCAGIPRPQTLRLGGVRAHAP
jgi:hypothetical protein